MYTTTGANRTRIPPPRIGIPHADLFIDPGWYGAVVEAEGTNEGLADLQERCASTGIFPPRAKNVLCNPASLTPCSRPGEIWLRTVGDNERLM
jgi:hypothetical protein